MIENEYDAIIVGAGVSGLVLLRRLKKAGQRVLVLEKSKGLGGRIATRRDGEASYDHGAQFYRISKGLVSDLDMLWTNEGNAFTWFENEDSQFKCAAGGLTSLVKALANKSEVNFEERVQSVREVNCEATRQDFVEVITEGGNCFKGRSVYLSSPLPQTIEILNRSKIKFSEDLLKIKYASALVGLFQVESLDVHLSQLKYLDNVGPEVFSISNQFSKKVSHDLAFTIVMQPSWSATKFEHVDNQTINEIAQIFTQSLKDLGFSARIKKAQLKKWRFSHPESTYHKPHEVIGQFGNIILLGDSFGGGSILGAIRSAESIHINT